MTFLLTQSKHTAKVLIKLENANALTEKGIRKAWFAVGQDLKRTADSNILKKPKSGRLYIRKDRAGRRRKHRASAPNETHANMTGALRKSMGWKVHGAQMLFGYGVTREPPEYAAAIEFGTKDGRIKPRPSLQNAIEERKKNTEQYLGDTVLKELL